MAGDSEDGIRNSEVGQPNPDSRLPDSRYLTPSAPGVTRIRLSWTNSWLLHVGRAAALVDCGTCHDRKRLLAALNAALPDGFDLQAVLLTHAHCDHAGNAAFLAERFGAKVYLHAEEAVFLATRRTYVPRGLRALTHTGLLFALGEIAYPVKRRSPDVLLADGDSVPTPIGPLRAVHTPGHTPGHTAYLHEERGWLFSGDALLNIHPWTQRVGLSLPPPVFTADHARCCESARRICAMDLQVLFAGHGPALVENTQNALRAFGSRL